VVLVSGGDTWYMAGLHWGGAWCRWVCTAPAEHPLESHLLLPGRCPCGCHRSALAAVTAADAADSSSSTTCSPAPATLVLPTPSSSVPNRAGAAMQVASWGKG